MTNDTASYHTATGYAPIDGMRYLQKPQINALRDEASQILLFQVSNYGSQGTLTNVSRGADEPDLLFWGRGTGGEVFGTLAGKKFSAAPTCARRISFTPRGVDSDVSFRASAQASNIMFPKGYLAGLTEEQGGATLYPYLFQVDERLLQLSMMLEHEIVSPGFASHILIDGLVRAVASLLAGLDGERIDGEAHRIYLPPFKVRRLVDFVEHHLDQPISLGDLASIAGLSPFHFNRVFKRAMGISPCHYVRDRRLALGRRLLTETDMGIANIALACGFANQSHFTAAFSKETGASPARFRQMVRA